MKFIYKLVFAVMVFVTGTAATTQQLNKPEQIIETEQSTIAVVRDKVDKSLSGDKLVFGSVVHMKKQVGVDNIRIIQRKGAYNCARGEFIIKESTAFDKEGVEVKDAKIKTDVIMTPSADTVKREFEFMCAEKAAAPVVEVPVEQPAPLPQIITIPMPVVIEAAPAEDKKAAPKPPQKKPAAPAPAVAPKAINKPAPVKAHVEPAQPLNPGQRTTLVD